MTMSLPLHQSTVSQVLMVMQKVSSSSSEMNGRDLKTMPVTESFSVLLIHRQWKPKN